MSQFDTWLAQATRLTRTPSSEATLAQLEQRLAAEPSPVTFQARRETRRTVLTVALATVLGFFGSGWLARTVWPEPSAPTWVAAPSAASPYSLLVGR